MLKLLKDRQAWITVKLPDPDGDVKLRIRVKLISHTENAQRKYDAISDHIARLQSELDSGTIDSPAGMLAKFSGIATMIGPEAIDHDLEQIIARITDWQDVGDESGNALAYSPEHMRSLLDMGTWVVKAVRQAITELDDDGRRKN